MTSAPRHSLVTLASLEISSVWSRSSALSSSVHILCSILLFVPPAFLFIQTSYEQILCQLFSLAGVWNNKIIQFLYPKGRTIYGNLLFTHDFFGHVPNISVGVQSARTLFISLSISLDLQSLSKLPGRLLPGLDSWPLSVSFGPRRARSSKVLTPHEDLNRLFRCTPLGYLLPKSLAPAFGTDSSLRWAGREHSA